jgi:energy-coupling factor transporter ATP-binding protein EcfA2
MEEFRLPFAIFDQKHVLITGATGSGKTRAVMIIVKGLIEAGGKVLIFDAADEYKHLCQFFPPDMFMVIDPKDLKINFLLPPPGVDPKIWRGVLIGVFRETMFLRDGSCNELNLILAGLDKSKACPTFIDLHNAILKRSYRAGSRRAQYIESLQNRSELLMNSYISDALMCCEGHPLDRVLIERSGCLRVGLISNDLVRNFYVVYVLKWIETCLTFNPEKR